MLHNYIDENILREIKNRTPIAARIPEDMLYYSNLQNRAALNQGFPQPGFHKYLNKSEEDRSHKVWDNDFEYHINELGFRGKYPSPEDENILGFFGCSCTFGEGLAEDDVFSYMVASHFNRPILNLGMPGTGCHRIAMTFAAAARIWNIKTAIITLPDYQRFHYVSTETYMYSVVPPHPTAPAEAETIRNDLVNHFSEQYHMSAASSAISWMISVAEERSIDLIIGSWSPHTSQLATNILHYKTPHFELSYHRGYARDKVHACAQSNREYADKLINYIDKRNYVKA